MNLEKRVKRHIWARDHRFLVTLPQSLNAVCLAELRTLGLTPRIRAAGGIKFTGRVEDAYRVHLLARTASRVWLCLPDFSAGAREELFRKTHTQPWELLINPEIPLKISARVRHSRIEHESSTAQTLIEAIQRRFREQDLSPVPGPADTGTSETGQPVQRIRLFAETNRVELHLDLTGTHLHKRGYRQHQGEAPLRETFAAGIIEWALDEWQRQHRESPWPLRIHDPFCGSGTIPIEAELLRLGRSAAGSREFLFMKLPHFRHAAFTYLRRTASSMPDPPPACRVSGCDKDAEMIRIACGNSRTAGVEIGFETADAFTRAGSQNLGPGTLVVTNPPYGERLAEGGLELYSRLVDLLRENGTSGVIVTPRPLLKRLGLAGVPQQLQFSNGGIPVSAVYL